MCRDLWRWAFHELRIAHVPPIFGLLLKGSANRSAPWSRGVGAPYIDLVPLRCPTCVLVLLAAFLICAAWPFTLASTVREPASIAWAERVAAAESQFRSSRTAQELVAIGRALIQLHRDCTACRENVYRQLKARLESTVEGRELVPVIEREENADAPLQLGRALLRQGSPLEARAVALREIDRSAFLEEQLEWVELLAHVHVQLGEVQQAERLIKRLRSETPVSPDYCAKEVKWRAWLTGSSETIEPIVGAASLDRALEEIYAHSQKNPTDPDTCCRIDRLIDGARAYASSKSRQASAADRLVALIPQGLDAAEVALARRTPDPKIRAAILLSRARRALPFERSRALELIYEASVAGPDPSIHMGTRAMDLTARDGQQEASRHELALDTLRALPTSTATCEACLSDWYWLAGLPDSPAHLGEWEHRCRTVIDRCPDRLDRWRLIAQTMGSAMPNARSVYEHLLAMALPSEVTPLLLLKLSDAIRSDDPRRALNLEHEAILHPQYPGIGDTYRHERRLRAEASGDFEAALFLDLLTGPPEVTCGNDCSSASDYVFRTAYAKLRLGLDTERQWERLLTSMPLGPADCPAPFFHTTAYFDRIIRAATAAGKKESALEWFRRLERRYEEDIEKAGVARRECLCGGSLDVPATRLLLHRYIGDFAPTARLPCCTAPAGRALWHAPVRPTPIIVTGIDETP